MTTNESASASIERDEMNPVPIGGEFTSDSESELSAAGGFECTTVFVNVS